MIQTCTRRQFSGALLAGVSSAPLWAAGEIQGVLIGVQGWSFRDRPVDDAIRATREIGIPAMELGWNHIEPPHVSRDEMRNWRLTVPLEEFQRIRRKFKAAGIRIVGYSATLRKDFTDEEIERTFQFAAALGVNTITTSTNVSMAERLDPYAVKHKMRVGFHNHSRFKADEFVRPEDFAAALGGRSDYLGINLDIGHFTAAGFDPADFIRQHHARIWSLHLKDRKRNQGPDAVFGEGDTPLREVLLLLKKERYRIPGFIEWENQDGDIVAAVRRCFEWCRGVLTNA
ncbi:MAG TPA: TIM barrel protein [Bryobacteraceae bacterium]|nr:TIM barrel protein [Bryobacteraceae bacterium]